MSMTLGEYQLMQRLIHELDRIADALEEGIGENGKKIPKKRKTIPGKRSNFQKFPD